MTSKFSRPSFVAMLLAGFFASRAQAHSDITPRVVNNRLQTDATDDGTGVATSNVRVFGYDFQEEIDDPYFIADPGFNTPAGGLPPASQLFFSIPGASASGLTRSLSYWNGSGPVSFGPVPSSEALRLELGSQSLTITGTTTAPQAGFALGTAAAGGSFHRHLGSALLGADGNATAGDGVVPANGIYVIPMALSSSEAGVQGSPTIWVVYNNGLSEAVHDVAIDHIEANVVPEPASAGLLMLGGLLTLVRRPRRRPMAVG